MVSSKIWTKRGQNSNDEADSNHNTFEKLGLGQGKGKKMFLGGKDNQGRRQFSKFKKHNLGIKRNLVVTMKAEASRPLPL